MHQESQHYDSSPDRSRSTAISGPSTALNGNRSSAPSSPGPPRRPRAAVAHPFVASFAAALELPVSPTSSSSSSLFSSAPTLSSVSATYQPTSSWTTSEPSRNVLALAPLIQGHTVAVGEVASSNESGGGYFGFGVGSGSGSGSGGAPADPSPNTGSDQTAQTSHNITTPSPDGTETRSRSTSSCSLASSTRRPSQDGRPPELTDLAPFSTVFSLSGPSSPASCSGADVLPPSGPSLVQDLSSLRRPPYSRAAESSEYRTVPRSYFVRSSDLDSYNGSHNDTHNESYIRLGSSWAPSVMIGNAHSEPGNEYVRKQFLPRGSVVRAPLPDGTGAAAAEGSAAEGSAAADIPPFLSPDSPLPDSDFVDFLNQDDRPTFIVDAANAAGDDSGPLRVAFANTALKERPLVLGQIANASDDPGNDSKEVKHSYALFKDWVLGLDAQVIPADAEASSCKQSLPPPPPPPPPPKFAGWRWAASTIQQHYRVIRGVGEDGSPSTPCLEAKAHAAPQPETAGPREKAQPANKTSAPAQKSAVLPPEITIAGTITVDDIKSSFDWTRIALTEDMPSHIAFARSIDWASTPLGPIENWASDLCLMSNLIMASPHPAAMYWGPKHTAIYNEAYTEMAGQKHPSLMGSNFPDSWAEVWEHLEPFFSSARNGEAVLKQDNRLFIERNGFLEETFFNWSLVPLVGSDGSVAGIYNPAFENTRRKVNERRMLLLNEVGERIAKARTVPEFWHAACAGLDSNEFEVPFALLYSVVENNGNEDEESNTTSTPSSSVPGSQQVNLVGSVGVCESHKAAVPFLDLSTSDEGFAPFMRQAVAEYQEASTTSASSSPISPSPIVLSKDDGTLPIELMAGLESERGFGDPCRVVVVIPVLNPSTTSTAASIMANLSTDKDSKHDALPTKSLYGFIVMGMNTRRPYDDDYRLFVHLLARQLTTSLASVVLFDEEVRRHRRDARRAAQDHQELAQQLLLRTRQAMESENKFMRMAEFTPVGMFVTDDTGKITYCNDMWWEISRHPKDRAASAADSAIVSAESPVPVPLSAPASNSPWATWMDSVQEEDQPALMVVWDQLVQDKMAITHEFRFKRNTTIHTDGNDPIEITTWVLLRAYPEKDENGKLKGIFGCITDISQQKLAEEFQIQLRKEAVEHKRQQENFIDITSHEMRNPLSAVLQTVDEITSSIAELRATIKSGKEPDYASIFDSILDASNTISICSNHQKRIVDDVLTLSKLDSRLMPVTPVDVQPVMVIRSTLEMFRSEMIAHDIHCEFQVQPSYDHLVGLSSWVKLDPSRLNQILINLLTNAIKFTESSGERSITIALGASEGSSDAAHNDIACPVADVSYVPSRQEEPEMANGPDWGDGQLINMHVAVSDTGLGLHEDEKSVLFQHFTQTFPRTHVQYGGSGLGLYICRNLAELQGGQIGVTSEKDRGSTFAFYVKCRRVPSTPTGVEPGSSDLSSIVARPSSSSTSAIVAYRTDGSRDGVGECRCKSKNFKTPTLLPQVPSPPVLIETPVTTPREETASELRFSLEVPASAPSVAITSADAATETPIMPKPIGKHIDKNGSAPEDEATPPLDVLIVEDNLVNQRVLQRQLDKGGNRTIVANHGGEALDILRQSTYWRATDEPGRANSRSSSIAEIGSSPRPYPLAYPPTLGVDSASSLELNEPSAKTNISIVLMDLEMPVMDGMTCARAIRALERSGTLMRHVPIIAVTAYARQEQIESAIAAGIDDVISKPFRLAQLMPKIQELVTKYNTYPSTLSAS